MDFDAPRPPRVLVITVSDTRTAADDRAGPALADELAAVAELAGRAIVPDDVAAIRAAVGGAARDGQVDAVVLTGGTGLAPRDVTVAALEPLFDKPLAGFGEAFRRLSWEEIGPRAVLSNATAGVVAGTVVFALPGSEKAARLGARALVAPLLAHAVDLVKGRAGAKVHA